MSIDVLQDKIRKKKNPSMLGLDPSAELIPEWLLQESYDRMGKTAEALADAYLRFCAAILHALKETVPAVKIQSACFDVLGAAGNTVMQKLMSEAQELGYYVVLDSMRGDAPHIAQMMADSVFGGKLADGVENIPWPCDSITLNGYLGSDSVKPFLPYCGDGGKSAFILVKTSNKSGREVQDLISGDRVVHTAMADLVMRWSGNKFGKFGFAPVGAVMPATDARVLAAMRKRYDRIFFLVAGYGAQGGIARHAAYAFDEFGHGAVVSASRSILGAWKKDGGDGRNFEELALEAAVKMKKDLTKFVTVI